MSTMSLMPYGMSRSADPECGKKLTASAVRTLTASFSGIVFIVLRLLRIMVTILRTASHNAANPRRSERRKSQGLQLKILVNLHFVFQGCLGRGQPGNRQSEGRTAHIVHADAVAEFD